MRIDMTSLEQSGSNTMRPELARWIKWLLIASLAVNVLVVGAVASAVWRGRSAHFFNMTGGANRDVNHTLTAEPFDKQRYIDAQARLLELEVRQRTVMRPWFAEMAAGMSAEERRAFLKWRGRDRFGQPRGGEDLADPPKQ
jgi:uncharacterized membrane protein